MPRGFPSQELSKPDFSASSTPKTRDYSSFGALFFSLKPPSWCLPAVIAHGPEEQRRPHMFNMAGMEWSPREAPSNLRQSTSGKGGRANGAITTLKLSDRLNNFAPRHAWESPREGQLHHDLPPGSRLWIETKCCGGLLHETLMLSCPAFRLKRSEGSQEGARHWSARSGEARLSSFYSRRRFRPRDRSELGRRLETGQRFENGTKEARGE